MGIFQRLFNLLEDECHMLDCSIAEDCDAISSFSSYLHSKTTIAALEQETSSLQSEINQAQQILTVLLLSLTDPQGNTIVQQVSRLIHTNMVKIRANVIYLYFNFINLHVLVLIAIGTIYYSPH